MALPAALSRRARLELNLAQLGVPGVAMFGRYRHTRAVGGLGSHRHPGAIEICFLAKGRQTYRVGGRNYRLAGGDLFLTYPGEAHSTGGLPQEKGVLYWLTLDAPRSGVNLLGLPSAQARALYRDVRRTPRRHFRGSRRMSGQLDTVVAHAVAPASPLAAFAMANALGAFLLELIACSRRDGDQRPAPTLRPVLAYIDANLDAPLTVPELAQRAGLSVSRFKARFKDETGVPPGEYIARARVNEARRRLTRGDASITRIAFDLGFSSSQYFATVYKRFTGKTPRAERGSG